MKGFLLAAFISLALIYGLFGMRIIRPARLGIKWKLILWALLFTCFSAVPLALTARYGFPDHGITIPLSWFAYASFGFFTLAFSALLLRDSLLVVGQGICRAFSKIFSRVSPPVSRETDHSRRLFLLNSTNVAILGVTGAMTGYGLAHARQVPKVVTLDIPMANLPPQFNGFTILQITDLHLSIKV